MLLHTVGVDASFFDAIAVLIAGDSRSASVGPTAGAAAAVLILGSDAGGGSGRRGSDDGDRHDRWTVLRDVGGRRSARPLSAGLVAAY